MHPKLKDIVRGLRAVVYGFCYVPIGAVMILVLMWATVISEPRERARRLRDAENAVAVPFAAAGNTSRRPLTPPRDSTTKRSFRRRVKKFATLSQAQSILFSLPLEVRLVVWNFCIGGSVYCLKRDVMLELPPKERAKAISKVKYYIHQDTGFEDIPSFCSDKCQVPAQKGLLSLPLTCQKLYAETLHLIYTQNTFQTSHSTHLTRPIWSSGRFDLLTSLKAAFHINNVPLSMDSAERGYALDWTQNWRTIASMPNLQCLTVLIQRGHLFWDGADEWYESREVLILEEPRKVTRPKQWVLWLSWLEQKKTGAGEQVERGEEERYPFEIRRQDPRDPSHYANWTPADWSVLTSRS